MSMSSKRSQMTNRYTYEDWLEDRIPQRSHRTLSETLKFGELHFLDPYFRTPFFVKRREWKIPHQKANVTIREGRPMKIPTTIPPAEFKKIVEAQKEAFIKAVEMEARSRIQRIHRALKSVPDWKEELERQRSEEEQDLNKLYYQKARAGEPCGCGDIRGKDHKRIEELSKKGGLFAVPREVLQNKKIVKLAKNPAQEAFVAWEVIKWIDAELACYVDTDITPDGYIRRLDEIRDNPSRQGLNELGALKGHMIEGVREDIAKPSDPESVKIWFFETLERLDKEAEKTDSIARRNMKRARERGEENGPEFEGLQGGLGANPANAVSDMLDLLLRYYPDRAPEYMEVAERYDQGDGLLKEFEKHTPGGRVLEGLLKEELDEAILDKDKYDREKAHKLIKGAKSVPYVIAILWELDFIGYHTKMHGATRADLFARLKPILDLLEARSEEQIKKEFASPRKPLSYPEATAHKHLKKVREALQS